MAPSVGPERRNVLFITDYMAAELGTPTVLVNNAGLTPSPADAAHETGRFEDFPERAWDTMLEPGRRVRMGEAIGRWRNPGA